VKTPDQSALPPIWVIGFTGHRHLPDGEKVGRALLSVVESLRAQVSGKLIGYSSIAIGADTLFAETCIALGIPWIALLPRPREDFKKDFTESDWAKTSELLQQAARVESLPPARSRDLGYLEGGLSTVDEADIMIAVWNGEPSRGTGGTAEVVAHAENLAKPIILIDPVSLQIRRTNFADGIFVDEEMDQLNLVSVQNNASSFPVAPAKECVRQFFKRVDARAAKIAPRYRRWIGASVIMNAMAAVLGAAAITLGLNSRALDLIIFLLTAAAMVAVAFIKRKGSHRQWIRNRIAAEICRSSLATWDLEDVAAPVWFNQLDGFGRLVRSVRLLRLSDKLKSELNLDDWRRNYLETRIDQQLGYVDRRRRRLTAALLIFTFGFWLFSAIGIARTILSALLTSTQSEALRSPAFHSFLPIALPLAAGCVLSLISIFDLHRQIARSKAMQDRLTGIRNQIEKAASLSSMRRAVENAENSFAAELLEWFTLYRYPRFN
jgi:hypothetical protein